MKKTVINLIILTLCLNGCAASNSTDRSTAKSQQVNAKSGNDSAVLSEYNGLIFGKDVNTQAIAAFIRNNADVVSAETVSEMILQFEEFQKNRLPIIEDKFNAGFVQKELMELYMKGIDINEPENIADSEVRMPVSEVKSSGYKLIQTDGVCYPVIDYSFYKAFGENVTPEASEYIRILRIDSEQPPLSDACLILSWDELLERAVEQEIFLTNFDGEEIAEKLRPLHEKYIRLIFFGSDNTPLFATDTGNLKEEVKQAFENAIKSNKDSLLIKKIKSFLKLLKRNDYRYTNDAEAFRASILP